MGGFAATTLEHGGNRIFAGVPGILIPGAQLHEPFLPALTRFGFTVETLDYDSPHFDPDRCVDDLVHYVTSLVDRSDDVTVFASSLGGMLSVMAIAEMDRAVAERVRWVVSDSPTRGRDLMVGPLPARANDAVGWLMRHFTPSLPANGGYGKWLLDKMAVPPREDAIQLPTDLYGSTGADTYRAYVQQTARRNLTQTPFTLYYDQVRWMLGRTTLPLDALDGLDLTYVACIRGNVTIRQPSTASAWRPYVRRLLFAPTAHVAYLEGCNTWGKLLRELVPLAG